VWAWIEGQIFDPIHCGTKERHAETRKIFAYNEQNHIQINTELD
jgi:hypothetical protein